MILFLIQIGGLGVMAVSVLLFQWFGRNHSFRQRKAMQDLFFHTPREDIIALVKNILWLHTSAWRPGPCSRLQAIPSHSILPFSGPILSRP